MANRNWLTNSLPYENGGVTALTSVLPVRMPIDPTISTNSDVLRPTRENASVTPTLPCSSPSPPDGRRTVSASTRPRNPEPRRRAGDRPRASGRGRPGRAAPRGLAAAAPRRGQPRQREAHEPSPPGRRQALREDARDRRQQRLDRELALLGGQAVAEDVGQHPVPGHVERGDELRDDRRAAGALVHRRAHRLELGEL